MLFLCNNYFDLEVRIYDKIKDYNFCKDKEDDDQYKLFELLIQPTQIIFQLTSFYLKIS